MRIENLKLPVSSRFLISFFLKWGGRLEELEGTNAYIVTFHKKEYLFFGEFTPFIPYMYGIVFSNQKYWFEILKELKINFAWEPKKREKRILFFITKDGYFNALLEKEMLIIGNGKDNLEKLLKEENIRRINSRDKIVMPIIVKDLSFRKVPAKGKILRTGNFDYENITEKIDSTFVNKARKIIDFLPGLSFLAFELFVKDPEKIGGFTIGKVSVNPGRNIFIDLKKGKTVKHFQDFIKELL